MQSLVATIDTLGNPFEESGEDLISLSSKVIVQTSLTKKVQQVRELGKEQYRKFVNERFVEHTVPLESPIPRNNQQPFKPASHPRKGIEKERQLKNDCQLFSRLYFACQSRDGDLKEFFKHENQPCPHCSLIKG